jgi:hypothetical protein
MDKERWKEAIDEPEKLVGEELRFTLKKGKKSFSFGTVKAVRREGIRVKLEFDRNKPGLGKYAPKGVKEK